MNKTILVGLAILTVSTSAASAWTDRTDESHAVKPHASAATMKPNASARAMNANAAITARRVLHHQCRLRAAKTMKCI